MTDAQMLARLAEVGRVANPIVPKADLLRLLDLAGYGDGYDAKWLRAQPSHEVETVGSRLIELIAEARAAAPGGGAGQVWVNSTSKVFRGPGDRY